MVVTYNIVVNCKPKHSPTPSSRLALALHVTDKHRAAYAGALDLIFVGLAWKTIMSLHMKMREKIGVALAMSMGTL